MKYAVSFFLLRVDPRAAKNPPNNVFKGDILFAALVRSVEKLAVVKNKQRKLQYSINQQRKTIAMVDFFLRKVGIKI